MKEWKISACHVEIGFPSGLVYSDFDEPRDALAIVIEVPCKCVSECTTWFEKYRSEFKTSVYVEGFFKERVKLYYQ